MAEEDPGPPIFAAVRAFDAEALRRELAAGVDPDMLELGDATPLYYAVRWRSAYPAERIRERLECISVLLEAGASVDKLVRGGTPLHRCAGHKSAAYQAVIAMLLEAGADPNFTDTDWRQSVLATAAEHGTAGAVRMIISAGAVDLDRALDLAITNGKIRNCAQLLRAGAALPAAWTGYIKDHQRPACAYIERIRAAGGFKAYETAHRQRLVAIFAPKFPHLPTDMLGRVLEFSYNVGGPSKCQSIAPKYLLD